MRKRRTVRITSRRLINSVPGFVRGTYKNNGYGSQWYAALPISRSPLVKPRESTRIQALWIHDIARGRTLRLIMPSSDCHDAGQILLPRKGSYVLWNTNTCLEAPRDQGQPASKQVKCAKKSVCGETPHPNVTRHFEALCDS